ncbi:uncharacterized protein [Littorina saxatilis]|uniref:Uncharacterized protein n=1 Tax=Littorina saxatilis TaxID=31220 RepID=A0AAN9GK83_9CAEN
MLPKRTRTRGKHGTGAKAAKTDEPSSKEKQQARDQAKAGPSTSGGLGGGQQLAKLHEAKLEWHNQVKEWFPNWKKQTYFLPPVFMRKIQRSQEMVCNQEVYVIKPPGTKAGEQGYHDKDRREDEAFVKVLNSLEQLTEREVMFVISKLEFRFYLNVSHYENAASMLPRPKDEGLPQGKETDGDFDILIIHRQLGLVAAEMKAVGENSEERLETQKQRDQNLVNKIEQAIKQISKSREMLKYLVSEDEIKPMIRTSLMLPNITTDHLRTVLGSNAKLEQDLRKSLDVDKKADLAELCLTKDDVENPAFPWWERFVTACGEDTTMTDSAYLDLISRFGGPATTVAVPPVKVFSSAKPAPCQARDCCIHSKGNGVAEAARRMAPQDIVLNRRQVGILTKHKEGMVYLTGPPGTGKSLVLIMKGLDWLRTGKAVQVVTSTPDGKAASRMIFAELTKSGLPGAEEKIKLLDFDLRRDREEDINAAVDTLTKVAEHGELYIVADEMCRNFTKLITPLKKVLNTLHIWAASIYGGHKPARMVKEELTEALRTPPRITKEVMISGYISHQNEVSRYISNPNAPTPCEGPGIISIIHCPKDGHIQKYTYDCEKCGEELASKLKQDLGVGKAGSQLKYSDVFVLDAEENGASSNMSPGSGLLKGLRDANIPVRVLKAGDAEKTFREVATMTGPNQVVVADCRMVSGLERPVVVWVEGGKRTVDEDIGRLHAMTRSTSQLIWVRPR